MLSAEMLGGPRRGGDRPETPDMQEFSGQLLGTFRVPFTMRHIADDERIKICGSYLRFCKKVAAPINTILRTSPNITDAPSPADCMASPAPTSSSALGHLNISNFSDAYSNSATSAVTSTLLSGLNRKSNSFILNNAIENNLAPHGVLNTMNDFLPELISDFQTCQIAHESPENKNTLYDENCHPLLEGNSSSRVNDLQYDQCERDNRVRQHMLTTLQLDPSVSVKSYHDVMLDEQIMKDKKTCWKQYNIPLTSTVNSKRAISQTHVLNNLDVKTSPEDCSDLSPTPRAFKMKSSIQMESSSPQLKRDTENFLDDFVLPLTLNKGKQDRASSHGSSDSIEESRYRKSPTVNVVHSTPSTDTKYNEESDTVLYQPWMDAGRKKVMLYVRDELLWLFHVDDLVALHPLNQLSAICSPDAGGAELVYVGRDRLSSERLCVVLEMHDKNDALRFIIGTAKKNSTGSVFSAPLPPASETNEKEVDSTESILIQSQPNPDIHPAFHRGIGDQIVSVISKNSKTMGKQPSRSSSGDISPSHAPLSSSSKTLSSDLFNDFLGSRTPQVYEHNARDFSGSEISDEDSYFIPASFSSTDVGGLQECQVQQSLKSEIQSPDCRKGSKCASSVVESLELSTHGNKKPTAVRQSSLGNLGLGKTSVLSLQDSTFSIFQDFHSPILGMNTESRFQLSRSHSTFSTSTADLLDYAHYRSLPRSARRRRKMDFSKTQDGSAGDKVTEHRNNTMCACILNSSTDSEVDLRPDEDYLKNLEIQALAFLQEEEAYSAKLLDFVRFLEDGHRCEQIKYVCLIEGIHMSHSEVISNFKKADSHLDYFIDNFWDDMGSMIGYSKFIIASPRYHFEVQKLRANESSEVRNIVEAIRSRPSFYVNHLMTWMPLAFSRKAREKLEAVIARVTEVTELCHSESIINDVRNCPYPVQVFNPLIAAGFFHVTGKGFRKDIMHAMLLMSQVIIFAVESAKKSALDCIDVIPLLFVMLRQDADPEVFHLEIDFGVRRGRESIRIDCRSSTEAKYWKDTVIKILMERVCVMKEIEEKRRRFLL